MRGRTVVVTGGNSGIGFEAARAFVGAGADVVLACRDRGKGDDAAERIRRGSPVGTVEAMRLDLASLGSVRASADALGERRKRIDVLVNNAGVMAPPRRVATEDGFEVQFGSTTSATSRSPACCSPRSRTPRPPAWSP